MRFSQNNMCFSRQVISLTQQRSALFVCGIREYKNIYSLKENEGWEGGDKTVWRFIKSLTRKCIKTSKIPYTARLITCRERFIDSAHPTNRLPIKTQHSETTSAIPSKSVRYIVQQTFILFVSRLVSRKSRIRSRA